MKGGKPEYPEKNPRSKDENQQHTQPTNAQPLRHPCSPQLYYSSPLTFLRF